MLARYCKQLSMFHQGGTAEIEILMYLFKGGRSSSFYLDFHTELLKIPSEFNLSNIGGQPPNKDLSGTDWPRRAYAAAIVLACNALVVPGNSFLGFDLN